MVPAAAAGPGPCVHRTCKLGTRSCQRSSQPAWPCIYAHVASALASKRVSIDGGAFYWASCTHSSGPVHGHVSKKLACFQPFSTCYLLDGNLALFCTLASCERSREQTNPLTRGRIHLAVMSTLQRPCSWACCKSSCLVSPFSQHMLHLVCALPSSIFFYLPGTLAAGEQTSTETGGRLLLAVMCALQGPCSWPC